MPTLNQLIVSGPKYPREKHNNDILHCHSCGEYHYLGDFKYIYEYDDNDYEPSDTTRYAVPRCPTKGCRESLTRNPVSKRQLDEYAMIDEPVGVETVKVYNPRTGEYVEEETFRKQQR